MDNQLIMYECSIQELNQKINELTKLNNQLIERILELEKFIKENINK